MDNQETAQTRWLSEVGARIEAMPDKVKDEPLAWGDMTLRKLLAAVRDGTPDGLSHAETWLRDEERFLREQAAKTAN